MASYDDGREYARKSRSEMRVPKWNGEEDENAVEYGEGYDIPDSRPREYDDAPRSTTRPNPARNAYDPRDYARDDYRNTYSNPRDNYRGERNDSRDNYRTENTYTRDARRYDGQRMQGDQKQGAHGQRSPVYGGRDHDNIPPADARPQIDRRILIALTAFVLVLIVVVPLMMRNVKRVSIKDNTKRSAAIITLSTAAPEATAVPEATGAPTEAATLSPGQIVSQYTGRTLDKNKPAVALTFDDGPSNQTGRILDALEKSGGLGTFFVLGDRVEQYADEVKREYSMGNLVGTHLYSHSKLTEMTAAEVENELSQCNAAHISILGTQPEVARTPYGATSTTVCEALGLPIINWSLNSNDWETRDADRIYNDVMNNVQDGDIVLFHDLKDFSASAVERIVPDLVKQGYQLVTVQELFELKGRTLEDGVVYSSRVTAAAEE